MDRTKDIETAREVLARIYNAELQCTMHQAVEGLLPLDVWSSISMIAALATGKAQTIGVLAELLILWENQD